MGCLGGLQGDDESLVPVEQTVAAVDDVYGRLIVLTRDRAAVLPLPSSCPQGGSTPGDFLGGSI